MATMRNTVVMCDGSVGSLVAAAAVGLRAATGPKDQRAYAFLYGTSEYHLRAAAQQATEFGLLPLPEQVPVALPSGEGMSVASILDAGLRVAALGGGELLWPAGNQGEAEPDVGRAARMLAACLLVEQLVEVATGIGSVKVEAPYADLTRRQLADLAIDMDLPVAMCWWMEASREARGDQRAVAEAERDSWLGLIRAAGWMGSFESKVHVKPEALSQFLAQPGMGVSE